MIEDAGLKPWELGRLHKSEKRVYLEGRVQSNQEERSQSYRASGSSYGVAQQKEKIEQGQEKGRQSVLDEINAEA